MSCEGCGGRKKGVHITDNPMEITGIIKNRGYVEGEPRAISIHSFINTKTNKKMYCVSYKLYHLDKLSQLEDSKNLELVWNA